MNKIVVITYIGCILLFSCKQPQPAKNPPVPVNLYTVTAQPVTYYDKYPANTVALSQVDLRPEVQGYITAISFTEGDHVKKGQKLYEIDQRLYTDAYDQAKANLEVAQGNLKQAQQDNDRYAYLISQDAVAKQTVDHAVVTYENAKNAVAAAEQAVKMAETNLTYSIISAPFDGTIGISQVRLGNMVTVGSTVLNTISTDDPMGVDFLISEKQLQHFEDLKDGKQQSIDSLFTIILPNGSVYPALGKISIIDRAVDVQTGTIRVRVVFPNPSFSLKPGLSCVLRVHNQEATPQLVVPSKAVVELMGEYFVYLAKDTLVKDPEDSTKTRPGMMAIQKKVQPGQTIAPNVIIKGGLSEGAKIVLDGVQSLHTGSVITPGQKPDGSKGEKKGTGEDGASTKKDSSKNSAH
ncbi:MAG TPA: efflux RND transporter periplasmic adaptor subunit [Bacteroidia bacterium]|jgi:RND family efflux transporter MFP subunit|nr:efflux RND transporter periplasmic adaptor subunit [Bacteroidia bacterium]